MCLWVAKFKLAKEVPSSRLNIIQSGISNSKNSELNSLSKLMEEYGIPTESLANGFKHADSNFLGLLSIVFVDKLYWNSSLNNLCFGKILRYEIEKDYLCVVYQGKEKCLNYILALSNYSSYFVNDSCVVELINESDPISEGLEYINLEEKRELSPAEIALKKVLSGMDTDDDLDQALFSSSVSKLGSDEY